MCRKGNFNLHFIGLVKLHASRTQREAGDGAHEHPNAAAGPV